MTGKDLFAALNHVDDALVAEAETYAAHKVIPMRTVRWIGTLAACVCLLVCWAAVVQWDPMSFLGGAAVEDAAMESSTAAATVETEGAMEQGVTEEAAAEEMETEETAENGAVQDSEEKSSAGGALPTEAPETEEETYLCHQMTDKYLIISGSSGGTFSDAKSAPENGSWVCEENLRDSVAEQLRIQKTPTMAGGIGLEIRFLAAFRLYKDGVEIDPDSEKYAAEIERLTGLGYEFRTLNVRHKDKSVKVQVCGLFTAEQLDQFDAKDFDASAEYSYVFYFPENEDGTPLDWEDQVELCGLPTADEPKAD